MRRVDAYSCTHYGQRVYFVGWRMGGLERGPTVPPASRFIQAVLSAKQSHLTVGKAEWLRPRVRVALRLTAEYRASIYRGEIVYC